MSSLYDVNEFLFVSLQSHTYYISVICVVFTCFWKESFCFTTKSHSGHFRHMHRVHMFSKRIFLCFHIIAFGTFPSYASSSHVFEITIFVFPQNRIAHISVICIIFTWARKYSFCFTTDSHLVHFRHMLYIHTVRSIHSCFLQCYDQYRIPPLHQTFHRLQCHLQNPDPRQ